MARRIVLGAQLRRLREARGVTRGEAAYHIRASESKISRMELGRVGCKERDIADLLSLYGIDDEAQRSVLIDLARETNATGWWHSYGDVLPGWFQTYVGLEETASLIRTYEVQFVPGLLQTQDYARAVTRLGWPTASEEEIERRVGLRMRRQTLLTAQHPPRLWALIDEAALRRPIGDPKVMGDQIRKLIALAEQPNITIQIMPFRFGGHAAEGGAFTLLSFPEQDLPDVVYLEQLTSALYLDKANEVDRYRQVMERLRGESCPPQEVPGLLAEILHDSYDQDLSDAPAAASASLRIGLVQVTHCDLMTIVGREGGGDVHEVVDTPFGVRLLIADAKGKDVRAARTAAVVRSAFLNLAPHEAKLSAMARRMHRMVAHHGDDEEFATALLAAIREDGQIELVCCGHPSPLLLRGEQVSFVEALPVSPPLGLLDLAEDRCKSMVVPFGPGDQLLLYTDGVTEARNADGRFYPLPERVAALRCEAPDTLVDALAADVHRYVSGRLADAAALLLVHGEHSHVLSTTNRA